jgi:hypothetical protein
MSENPYSGRFWLANDESEHAFGALSLTFKMANDGGGDLHMQLSYLAETAGEVRQEISRNIQGQMPLPFRDHPCTSDGQRGQDRASDTCLSRAAGLAANRKADFLAISTERVRGYKIACSAVARTGSSILRRVPC